MKMWSLGIMALLAVTGAAHAKVVIHGTRVVYPAHDPEVIVRLSNLATDKPSVMQIWLDAGNASSSPDEVAVPFVTTPPVFRIEAGGSQSIRLSYTGEPLPEDRESLFWMNVLEIPPVPEDAANAPQLQFSYRTRLKTFFRPRGLETVDALKAPSLMTWSLQPAVSGRPAKLKVVNPTPFHVSLASVQTVQGEKRVGTKRGNNAEANLVRPFSSQEFELNESAEPVGGTQIEFIAVGDYGNRDKFTAPMASARP